jgi:hypothetical protein
MDAAAAGAAGFTVGAPAEGAGVKAVDGGVVASAGRSGDGETNQRMGVRTAATTRTLRPSLADGVMGLERGGGGSAAADGDSGRGERGGRRIHSGEGVKPPE